MQRIGIFARRNIAPDEEITIDYNFSHFGEAADCKCGSTACTGKLGVKRSKLPSFNPRVVGTAKAKKQVLVDETPPELKRPVHLTSLALLKSSQMDESWLDYYGLKYCRLFLSHRPRRQKKEDDKEVNTGEVHRRLPSCSPASECSTTTEEDVSLTPPQAIAKSDLIEKRPHQKNWYEKVTAGEHLPEMRALHSYICGGKSDWSAVLQVDHCSESEVAANSPSPLKKRGPGRPPKKRSRPRNGGPCSFHLSVPPPERNLSALGLVSPKHEQEESLSLRRLQMASPSGTSASRRPARSTPIASIASSIA